MGGTILPESWIFIDFNMDLDPFILVDSPDLNPDQGLGSVFAELLDPDQNFECGFGS
jgi:hypothetical protein